MTTPSTPDRAAARNYAARVLADPDYHSAEELAAARVLLAVLPKHPTLADMTAEERAECQGMQADTKKRGRAIITDHDWWDGHADLIDRQGKSFRAAHDTITPRPDLPRFEWPGEHQPAPTAPALPDGWKLADHKKHGRVIVINHPPNPSGYAHFLTSTKSPDGFDWHYCNADALTYLDNDKDTQND